MPRTHTVTEYAIDQLSPDAKQRALNTCRYWNVEDIDWWDFFVQNINQFGETSGLRCVYGKSFDIDRGAYVHIVCDGCTVSDLLAKRETAAGDYPDVTREVLEPFFAAFTPKELRQLERLERRDILCGLDGHTTGERKGRAVNVDRYDGWDGQTPRITRILDALEAAWEYLLRDLESYYLRSLRAEYEYLTSDEAVEEIILANEVQFDAEGHISQ